MKKTRLEMQENQQLKGSKIVNRKNDLTNGEERYAIEKYLVEN